MTLLSSMTRNLGMTKRVSINEVRINRLNEAVYDDASDDIIAGLMNSILENGQMENAIAYESTVDFDGETDGCKYTLLGGHTRYLAICKLYENGMGDGRINISVVEKPNTENDELALIMENNVQRKKSAEVRYNEIQMWSKIYEELEERPRGTKRDWIGSKIGMSGRGVDKVISKIENTSQNQSRRNVQLTQADIIKRLKTNYKSLNRTIELLDRCNCNYMKNDIYEIIAKLNALIQQE